MAGRFRDRSKSINKRKVSLGPLEGLGSDQSLSNNDNNINSGNENQYDPLEIGLNRPRRHTVEGGLIRYHKPNSSFIIRRKNVKKLQRAAVVLVFFFCSYYVNLLASVIAGYRTPNVKGLPDISHEFVDEYIDDIIRAYVTEYQVRHLPDYFLTLSLLLGVSFWLADNRKFVIVVRFLNVTSLILLFRAYCITITNLPDMSPHCQRQFEEYTCWGILKCPDPSGAYKKRAIFPGAIYRTNALLVTPFLDTCGDLMFSGHTVGIWLVQMLYMEYCDLTAINCIMTCLTIVGTSSIIFTKFHYALDVSIAIFVVYCTWTIYHRWSKSSSLQKSSMMGKPFIWMESAMDKHTENKFYYA